MGNRMPALLRHAGAALCVLLASGLASSPAVAHVALVRGLATAAERTALDIPGFGVAFASDAQGSSYRYACDAQLGTTPYAEERHLLSLEQHGWLLVDAGGLHRISPSGCEAAAPEGFPSERAVAAVAVAPGAESTVYVVDDQSRLYRSDDAGATWRVLAELATDLPVTGLAIAGDGQRLYVSQSGADQARLAWSSDAGATFATTPLPAGAGLVTLEAVESREAIEDGRVDRLWLSASASAARDVAIWRMVAGGEPETVHRVRFFGGLALADGAVWVGDEAGGLYRSEHDEPFSVLAPDLAVSCLHHDRAGSLWVCTPATSDQNTVLVSDDRGDTLRPQLALQDVQTLVECPDQVGDPCASAWNEWEVDVLRRATAPIPGLYPGTASSVATPTSVPPAPMAMSETAADELGQSAPRAGGCSLDARAGRALPGLLGLLLLSVTYRKRASAAALTGRRRRP
jgi:hypothetical protein